MKNVVIYTTNTCSYCKMVKMFLDRKNVNYTVINLDDHPEKRQEAINISGAMTVPVTVINGNPIVGWQPIQLAKALA